MASFQPVSQPNSLGTAGTIVEIPIQYGFQEHDIVLIEVEQISGRATHTSVEFSTDPTFINPASRVATFIGLSRTSPVCHTNYARYYTWDEVESSGSVWCRLIPDYETDNDYLIRVHISTEAVS